MLIALDQALRDATSRVAEQALSQFGAADIYGFSLYTSGDFQYLTDSLFTESGLREITHRYFDKHKWFRDDHPAFEDGMRELRWSPCDSPWHLYGKEEFNRTEELLDALWKPLFALPDPYEDDGPFETLCIGIEICMLRSLAHLRSCSILPESVVLCLMMGDQSDEKRLAYAEALNPPETTAVFREKLGDLDSAVLDECRSQIPDYTRLPQI